MPLKVLIAGAALALAPVAAAAQEPQACFAETPLTAQLARDALSGDVRYFSGDSRVPPFVVAHLSYLRDAVTDEQSDVHGSVIFLQRDGGWAALIPSQSEAELGVYVSRATPEIVAVLQLQIEGPGQSFTFARYTPGLRSGACVEIPFPGPLNKPSWAMETLTLEGVQIDERGKGRLVGSAEMDLDSARPYLTHWRYDTRDGGVTWSRPRRVSAAQKAGKGALTPVDAPAPESVKAAIIAFAADR